jgi:hypothetical protein
MKELQKYEWMKDGEKDKKRDIVDRKERKIRKYPGNGHTWE